jgi:hypothetical protein
MPQKVDALIAALERLNPPARPLPRWFARDGAAEDAPELIDATSAHAVLAAIDTVGYDARAIEGHVFGLVYRDDRGTDTTRDVKALAFLEFGGHEYLHAHCFMRDAERTFRARNIIRVIDFQRDETHAPPDRFLAYLRRLTGRDPAGTTLRQAIDLARDAARVLTFLGRSDVRLTEAEHGVISLYLSGYLKTGRGLALDDQTLDDLDRWATALSPTTHEAVEAIAAAYADPYHREHLANTMRDLVGVDGEFHPRERAALEALRVGLAKA